MTLAPFPTTDFTGIIASEPALNEFEALYFTVDVDYCGTYEVCIPSYASALFKNDPPLLGRTDPPPFGAL